MATAATATPSRSRNFDGGNLGGVTRNLFGVQGCGTETTGNGNINTAGTGRNVSGPGIFNTGTNSRVGAVKHDREDRRRELSGDEIEDPDEIQPATKRIKTVEEIHEVPASFFGQIVAMLETFQTKGTVWYSNPEAEKKRDKTAFVLWKGRTKPDGTMTLSIMDQTRIVREVIATEVSIAQQFKDIFDPNSASRIFQLVGNGANIQKAVFQTLNEQNEGSGSD